MADINVKSLTILLRNVSRGPHSTDTVREIKQLPPQNIGIDFCYDTFVVRIRVLIVQIKFTEKQVTAISKKLNSTIMITPGVTPSMEAITLGGIGDINHFT